MIDLHVLGAAGAAAAVAAAVGIMARRRSMNRRFPPIRGPGEPSRPDWRNRAAQRKRAQGRAYGRAKSSKR